MSDYRAIATVTAVIRDILINSQDAIGSNATVKTSSPANLKEPANDADILNLFLYQVNANTVCHSLGLPARNQNGKLMIKPQLALDLHYLLTAASKNELKAQLMLSSAMMALQENAIIPRNKIRNTLSLAEEADEKFLFGSNIADQFESLKISLQSISTEELTKLWSSFFQTGYRLSIAYHVSMVLLESTLEPAPSLPVSKRQLQVIAIKQPIIEKIEPQIMTYDPAKKLVINGRNFSSDKVLVRLNGKEIKVEDSDLSDNQISLLIPKDTLAGVKQVQVLQKIHFSQNDEAGHSGYTSNIAAFVLTPNLKTATPPSLKLGETLKLNFEPGVDVNQKVNILIGDYVIKADLPPPDPDNVYPLKTLKIKIPSHILAGTYPVRIRIDNADSPLNNNDETSIQITNAKQQQIAKGTK